MCSQVDATMFGAFEQWTVLSREFNRYILTEKQNSEKKTIKMMLIVFKRNDESDIKIVFIEIPTIVKKLTHQLKDV